ncbi:MAG: 8-oxo-dGTP diphosphatase, partial [Halieaceae bacterium]
ENSEYALTYYQISYDKFFQFGLSADCVVFGYHEETLKVLLIKRGAAPFKGEWALPGDLVYPNENMDVAAQRVLHDLTGIKGLFMEQTRVYGKVDRHPAGRVITTGYYSLIDISKHDPHASAWADGVYWIDIDKVPALAFDHNEILKDALKILRRRVRRRPVGFELLPQKFTLAQLQQLYEVLLNEQYDKANFRKKILAMNLLKDLKENQTNVSHRPAKLFSFDEFRYIELKSKGMSFEL